MSKIKLGTGGWRAVIGEDFTFHNLERVAQATALYWKTHPIPATKAAVVVGYDRRFLADQFALRTADGRGIRVLLEDSPSRHGRMVARHAGGGVEFITPSARRRATAYGLSAAWAALHESIRHARPINDSQEACRTGALMLSPAFVFAAEHPWRSFPSPLPETA